MTTSWIAGLIFCFICCLGSKDLPCREAIFKVAYTGQLLDEHIISSCHVDSWFECGQKCLDINGCVAFSHRTESRDDINCKIASETDDVMKNSDEIDTWTVYKILEDKPEICIRQEPCDNGGSCVRSSCEPRGYSCICSQWYHGEHCENENSDFDVVFSSQDQNLSYIEMDSIKSNLDQFTFTAWFKFKPGIKKYHLLSYKTNGNIDFINLFFHADKQSVDRFTGKILQHTETTYMTPVNDNVWHHLGFVWSNTNGLWNVLIDGTPRALRDSVKAGAGAVIPGGGTLVIGQRHSTSGFKEGEGFLGQISGLNIWNKALTGEEIETMSESRGDEQGNVLRWFNVLNSIVGNTQLVMPSNARNTNKDLNYKVNFKSSQFGYVLSPGPAESIKQLSGCLWLKTSATSTFFSYYVEDETSPGFQFGITSSNFLFAKINGSLAKSTYADDRIVNNYWHFICVIWDGVIGNVKFYYEGSKQPSGTLSGPITQLLPRGKFVIGAIKGQNNTTYSSSFVGYLSCINVWSIIIPYESIISMASGGMNINGDYLAWRDVRRYILGNLTVVSNTTIHFPGYSLLERRSKWCNEITTSLSCGPFYARLGEGTGGGKMPPTLNITISSVKNYAQKKCIKSKCCMVSFVSRYFLLANCSYQSTRLQITA